MDEELDEVLAFPLRGMLALQRGGEDDAEVDGVQAVAVRDDDLHAAAFLAREDARGRREAHGDEADAGQLARQLSAAASASVVDLRRADALEGRLGAAADADVGDLQQADAGVERGGGQAAHVRRRIHPRQAGPVEPGAARPAFARHDGEIGADFALGGEHLRQFADGHAVAHGQRRATR